MDIKPVITVSNVSKSFKIPLEHSSGLKQKLINFISGKKGYKLFTPLSEISFDVRKGEFFGIVGKNGSGKSTLLKTIAEIYTPDKGTVNVDGTLVPFIELGVGFNPELTGRENVYLNGSLLGFSRDEIKLMYEDIVNFAELRDFMDERLKNYSSGMQVRLAFSIAIRAKSDVLLLDEILAVGDEAFQKKCIDYFYSLKDIGQTIVLVTHDMTNVEKFCDRVLVLDKGRVLGIYKPAKAKLIYEQLNRPILSDQQDKFSFEKRWGTHEIEVSGITIDGKNSVKHGDAVSFKIAIKSNKLSLPITLGLAILDQRGDVIAGPNSEKYALNSRNKHFVYTIKELLLNPGIYSLRVALFSDDYKKEYDHIENALTFEVRPVESKQYHGRVTLKDEWSNLGD